VLARVGILSLEAGTVEDDAVGTADAEGFAVGGGGGGTERVERKPPVGT